MCALCVGCWPYSMKWKMKLTSKREMRNAFIASLRVFVCDKPAEAIWRYGMRAPCIPHARTAHSHRQADLEAAMEFLHVAFFDITECARTAKFDYDFHKRAFKWKGSKYVEHFLPPSSSCGRREIYSNTTSRSSCFGNLYFLFIFCARIVTRVLRLPFTTHIAVGRALCARLMNEWMNDTTAASHRAAISANFPLKTIFNGFVRIALIDALCESNGFLFGILLFLAEMPFPTIGIFRPLCDYAD